MADAVAPGRVRVGPVTLGASRPVVIVPVMPPDESALRSVCDELSGHGAEIVEWRIDAYLRELAPPEHVRAVVAAIPAVRERLAGAGPGGQPMPLLVSLRTAAEGGRRDLDEEAYLTALEALVDAGGFEMLDVEALRLGERVRGLIARARRRGIVVVGSHHDLEITPSSERMATMLQTLQELGADVPKLAVTPRTAADVIALLEAGRRHAESAEAAPAISISMGPLGLITRLAGPRFGSCATFAALGEGSAPGQVGVDALVAILDEIES